MANLPENNQVESKSEDPKQESVSSKIWRKLKFPLKLVGATVLFVGGILSLIAGVCLGASSNPIAEFCFAGGSALLSDDTGNKELSKQEQVDKNPSLQYYNNSQIHRVENQEINPELVKTGQAIIEKGCEKGRQQILQNGKQTSTQGQGAIHRIKNQVSTPPRS